MRWTLVLVACSACYAPRAQPGAACPSGECPEGLVCSPATATCELRAADAGTVDTSAHDAIAGPLDASLDAAPSMPMLVQQTTNAMAVASSLSATLGSAPASGNVLVMIGATPSGGLASVTGGGATWSRAASSLINSNIEVWVGVTNGSSATVTIARPNNAAPMWLHVAEWANLAASPLDAAADDDGTANPVTAGAITTTKARDLLIFAATAYAPNSHGAPGPSAWTALTPISTAYMTQGAWYRVEAATGTFAPQLTQTGGAWDAAIVALRIAP